MKIATWNINGIKARLGNVETWLKEAEPDLVCLQEIKSVTENFPGEVFEALGYNVAVHGQKSFNGVAMLSKHPLEDVTTRLPGDEDDHQARYIEAVVSCGTETARIVGLYLPNGNPVATEKYTYKQAWMDRLKTHTRALLDREEVLAIVGDYNIIPEPRDCHDPANWVEDALYQPASRDCYFELVNMGLTDAVRASTDAEDVYTFWDYQAGAWQKNHGIRIDHILLSPSAADRLENCQIDKHTRGWEKPSDHVPVWVELQIR